MSDKKVTLGIDLGTTYSCMAGVLQGKVQIIENKEGDRTTPSVVYYKPNSPGVAVGNPAIQMAQENPSQFIYEAKRMIARGYYDKDIQATMNKYPFKIKEIKTANRTMEERKVASDNAAIEVKYDNKVKDLEVFEVSAAVLNYLYDSAQYRLGASPNYVVVTVPAYFNDNAKRRTITAMDIAFNGKVDENNNPVKVEYKLLTEPTSAGIAYAVLTSQAKEVKDEQKVLIFDLGGGTFDVSFLSLYFGESTPTGEVLATDGDNYLGGADFDNIIIKKAKESFYRRNPSINENSLSPEEKQIADMRLRQYAIKMKTELSQDTMAEINLERFIANTPLNFRMTRNAFESASRPLFDKLLERVKGVLLSYKNVEPIYDNNGYINVQETMSRNKFSGNLNDVIQQAKLEIDKVILVGGSSRIPKVQSMMKEFFKQGLSANQLEARKNVFVNPCNEDEAVAMGAGLLANSIYPHDGSTDGTLILSDINPFALNIDTQGNIATPIIPAKQRIPCSNSQVFTTAEHNQTAVTIKISQGNRALTKDNVILGDFTLSGIPPQPKGVPKIKVTYTLNDDNILHVSAVDEGSKTQKEFTVTNMSSKLNSDDIERMKADAEKYKEYDAEILERRNSINKFYALIDSCEDQVSKLDESVKAEVQAKIDEYRTFCDNEVDNYDSVAIKEKYATAEKTLTEMIAGKMGGAAQGTSNPDVEEVL